MTHALARRRSDAGDVGDDGLGHVLLDEVRAGFLIAAADFADHHDAFGARIAFEQLQHIDEVQAADRIAADADAGALAKAIVRGLEHSFVGQRAGARDDTDRPLLVDEARHDADLAFARCDHARAVRSDQPHAGTGERGLDADHVIHRNALGDAHDEFDAAIGRFENRIGGVGRRHVDHADRGAGGRDRIVHGVEHRQIEVTITAATRRDSADDLRAVRDALFGMERPLLAREALADDLGIAIDENAHEFNLCWRQRFSARPRRLSSRRQSDRPRA